MGNILCLEPSSNKKPSFDILFYEVATPKPSSSSQTDPLAPSHHQIEELVTPAEIEGVKNGAHRDLLLSASSSRIQDDRPTMTASSTSSSTIETAATAAGTNSGSNPTMQGIFEEANILDDGDERTDRFQNIEEITNHDDDEVEASLDLLGVSVDHFELVLYPQFRKAGHNRDSKMYIVENLKNATHGFSSVIRDKGKNVFCPMDGQRGASYVHALVYDTDSTGTDGKQYVSNGGEPDVVGPASIMISYSWDYTIGDILDTIVTYCDMNKLDKKSTYIWIDCLCINLHRVVDLKKKELNDGLDEHDYAQDEKKSSLGDRAHSREGKREDVLSIFESSDELQSTIQHRIQNIGHVLAIMSPFHQPTYLSRLWCMYELGVANTSSNHLLPEQLPCKITIAIPPTQKEVFMAAIETDTINAINKLYELVNVEVSIAKTTVEEDSMFIFDLIQQGQPQRPRSRNNDRYHGFHNMMKILIRNWVTNLLTSGVEEKTRIYMEEHNGGGVEFNFEEMKNKSTTFAEEELAQFYNHAAYAFRKNNENEHSLELYRKALRIKEALLDLQVSEGNDFTDTLAMVNGESKASKASSSIASTYNSMSIVLQNLGELDEALEMLHKCLEIHEAVLSPNNITTASTYHSISQILQEQNKLADALDMNTKSLETFEAVLGTGHPSTATIYDSIASQLQSMGQLDEAMVMYRKALTIKEKELGYHANTAKSYASIASLLEDKGEIEDALKLYKKCVKIQEAAIGTFHPDTAATYNNIARILHGLGNKKEALATWTKALNVLKENIGPDHTQVLVQALVDKLGSR